MKKQKAVCIFNTSHEIFRKLVKMLNSDQLISIRVLDEWTVKDIIAHLSAWNWEQAKEIDNILKNNPTWSTKYKTKKDENDFNRKAVDERRSKPIKGIIDEWEDSFTFLLEQINKLNDGEWNKKEIQSLFKYEKTGLSDEGQHADQIKKFFKF